MKVLLFVMCFGVTSFGQEGQRSLPHGPRVIPVLLDEAKIEQLALFPGDEAWFELVYSGSPEGRVIHEEVAEKLWWIQGKPLLLLGSTGLPLPPPVMRRATAYVRICYGGKEIQGSPFLLEPRKTAVVIGSNVARIQAALGKRLLNINASYIAQVANYLANHSATLDVQGSSYGVDGYGTLIDSGGEWVGMPVLPLPGKLIRIKAGSFTQGSSGEPCAGTNETPFEHTLTRDLLVMETEVTRYMWLLLAAAQPSLPPDPSDTGVGPDLNHPVQQVTWFEAVLFANLLSVERGLTPYYYTDTSFTVVLDSTNYTTGPFFCNYDAGGYRLPTEGEWEYFTRAGTTGPFSIDEPNYSASTCDSSTGGELPNLETVATFWANGPGGTTVAGANCANPWGLKDVHGNVVEYCWDHFDTYPSGNQTDYRGGGNGHHWGANRARRGGGWDHYAKACRSAYRFWNIPDYRYNFLGFRLVRTSP